MQQAGSAFDGVSFHCYQGSVSDQASFTSQYPSKVIFGLLVNSSLSEFV
jgi:O-glycosyl hydrolase